RRRKLARCRMIYGVLFPWPPVGVRLPTRSDLDLYTGFRLDTPLLLAPGRRPPERRKHALKLLAGPLQPRRQLEVGTQLVRGLVVALFPKRHRVETANLVFVWQHSGGHGLPLLRGRVRDQFHLQPVGVAEREHLLTEAPGGAFVLHTILDQPMYPVAERSRA